MEHATPPVDSTRARRASPAGADRGPLGFMNLYRVYHQTLSESESEALGLVEVEGASYEEVARQTGTTSDEIQMLIWSARHKLFFGMARTLAELGELPTD